MSKQFDKKFKEDAVRYYFDHKDLGLKGCAEKLGVSRTALSVWAKEAKANNGEVQPEVQAIMKAMRLRRMLGYVEN